jgi:SAM-dependent methyltransferase
MGDPARPLGEGLLGPAYDARDAEALDRLVGPRYLALFAQMLADRLAPSDSASIIVAGTLASVVVPSFRERMPAAHLRLVEASASLVEHVRRTRPGLEVHTLSSLPVPLRDGACSHAVLIHPLSAPRQRRALLSELLRLLVPGGQLLVCTPLRGSFPELLDMLREYAVKHDAIAIADAIESAAAQRPNPESFGADLEQLGFTDVEVDVELSSVRFESGREFENHPLFRLVLAPDLARHLELPQEALRDAMAYARDAIAKYWSDVPLDVTLNVGCATGRRPIARGS